MAGVRDEPTTMDVKPVVPSPAQGEPRDQAFVDVLCVLYGYDCPRCRILRCRRHPSRRGNHEPR